jgi:hypothetical protein
MLNEDYKEMLQNLLDQKVEFLVVGAYALAAHGFPRATGDMDIWIKPDQKNSKKDKLFKLIDPLLDLLGFLRGNRNRLVLL